jgi:hypothetical protein
MVFVVLSKASIGHSVPWQHADTSTAFQPGIFRWQEVKLDKNQTLLVTYTSREVNEYVETVARPSEHEKRAKKSFKSSPFCDLYSGKIQTPSQLRDDTRVYSLPLLLVTSNVMLYVPQESPPIARKGARKNERFDESSRA